MDVYWYVYVCTGGRVLVCVCVYWYVYVCTDGSGADIVVRTYFSESVFVCVGACCNILTSFNLR